MTLALRRPLDRVFHSVVAIVLMLALGASLSAGVKAVRGVIWDAPSHAMSPADTPAPATVDPAARVPVGQTSVIIQALPGQEAAAASPVSAHGGQVGTTLPIAEGFAATVPTNALDAIAGSGSIRAITANSKVNFEELSYDDTTTASNFTRTSGA